MCQALPRRVLSAVGDRVLVEVDDQSIWVRCAGPADVQPGEYVLVYAGHAVERLDRAAAEELLAVYASLETTP